MPSVQVRDIPADIYEKLSITAEMERRSVSEQIIVALRSFLKNETPITARDECAAIDAEFQKLSARGEMVLAEDNVSQAALPETYEALNWKAALHAVREDRL